MFIISLMRMVMMFVVRMMVRMMMTILVNKRRIAQLEFVVSAILFEQLFGREKLGQLDLIFRRRTNETYLIFSQTKRT